MYRFIYFFYVVESRWSYNSKVPNKIHMLRKTDSSKSEYLEIFYFLYYRCYEADIFRGDRSFYADYESTLRWATTQYFSRYSQPWLFKTMVLCRKKYFSCYLKTLRALSIHFVGQIEELNWLSFGTLFFSNGALLRLIFGTEGSRFYGLLQEYSGPLQENFVSNYF